MRKSYISIAIAASIAATALVAAGCEQADAPQGELVNAATPVITEQPQDLSLRKGEQTRGLSVSAYAADGGSLSYRWYENTTDVNTGGTTVDGGTGSVLEIDTSTDGVTYYYCVVTNNNSSANGNQTATAVSETAQVRIFSETETPRIESEPQGCDYVFGAQNEALPLSVEAAVSKGELSYQWYSTKLGSFDGAQKIEGAVKAKYTPDISERGSTYYFCEVTNTDETASEGTTASVRTKMVSVTIDYDYAGFTFEAIDENACKLTAYSGSSLKPYIPDTDEDGRAVVEIGKGVFAGLSIVEVTIPDTVEKFGWYNSSTPYGVDSEGVFNGCTALRTVNYGGKIKELGDFTFSKCSALETDIWAFCDELVTMYRGVFQNVSMPVDLVIPASYTGAVNKYTFQNAKNIKTVTFAGNGATSIEGAAFSGISTLESITIPSSVTKVGDCLKEDPALTSVTFERSIVTHGSITSGVPFSGTNYANMTIHVPFDSYSEYTASLGSYKTYVETPPPATYTLTVEGATVNGERSINMLSGATLDADATVVYDDEMNCLGWAYGEAYYANYAELAGSFIMGAADTTVKAVYAKDFTQVFTPSCRTERMADSTTNGDKKGLKTTQEHVKVGDITATRIRYSDNADIKILNASHHETHGAADGVYNACPINPEYKTCLLMTFINNSAESITIRYEVEYNGVIGSVTVELAAGETRTALVVETLAASKPAQNTSYHQLRIVSGGDSGYDLTIYGMRVA